jgi:hypothetical protein
VRTAFEEYDGDPNMLVGYTQITGHLVFNVKLGENFRRKARNCADGHKTGAPASVTYSTVVSRDSVRILLTIAALNGLDVLGADIQNACLMAPNKEKCWMIASPELGTEEGKTFLVVKVLYSRKSASFSFRSYMAGSSHKWDFNLLWLTQTCGCELRSKGMANNTMSMCSCMWTTYLPSRVTQDRSLRISR